MSVCIHILYVLTHMWLCTNAIICFVFYRKTQTEKTLTTRATLKTLHCPVGKGGEREQR